MNIKRLSVYAIVLSAFFARQIQADDVVVTLDVTFASSAPGAFGDWELFGRVEDTGSGPDGSFGISAIRALLTEIDFGTDGDAITIVPGIGAITLPSGQAPVLQFLDGTVDLFYGQDMSDGPSVVPNVGNNGDALIAFGTFSAGQSPGFGQDGDLFTQALFLNTDTPPFGASFDPGSTITHINQSFLPEPTSLSLLLFAGLALTCRRRSRHQAKSWPSAVHHPSYL